MDCSTSGLSSITNTQSLLKLMFIESVMPSKHLILSSPSPPAFNLSQHRVFSNESALCLRCVCEVAQSCPTLCDPVDCSPPGSSVHGFSRQEYWSGLPFPFPGDLPNPGIEPGSPALAGAFFVIGPPRKHKFSTYFLNLSKLWEIVEDS